MRCKKQDAAREKKRENWDLVAIGGAGIREASR
jgi:hypothetical protein